MRVISKMTDDPTVIGGPPVEQGPIWRRLQPRLSQQARCGFRTGNPTMHSTAWPSTGLGQELEQLHVRSYTDVVHLHWLGNSTLSIEEVGHLPMPLVWTLHDQWPFCGAEHYTSPPLAGESASSDERFSHGYTTASRPNHESGPDLNRRIWLRKSRAWLRPGRNPIQIACPSTWMADCARRSALMADWPITVIPYPIDLQVWAPFCQRQARALLHLPQDRPLVLFGAVGGTTDPRKGADLLLHALQLLRANEAGLDLAQLELVMFGQSCPKRPNDLGFPIHYSGRLYDDISLRLLYASADLFVIPSLQDNLPNTGLEAHACATPVVAFRTGGLTDIVADRCTGALAEPFDAASLAAAIRWVLEDPHRCQQLGAAARQRAERLWDPARVSGLYAHIYHSAVEQGIHACST
jgi:glycosyltransferase involved in cell wall biosynthesis